MFPECTRNGIGRLNLEDSAWGWRAGLAYEIPEYAFRASLVYNSEVKLDDITGTLDLTQVPRALTPVGGSVYNVFGSQNMPDTLELKVQTGVARVAGLRLGQVGGLESAFDHSVLCRWNNVQLHLAQPDHVTGPRLS